MENKKFVSSKQLKIKPLKEQWIMWSITAVLAFILIVVIGAIISVAVSEKIPWKYVGIVFAIFLCVIVSIAVISRLLYRGRLIVTENEVIKLHGNKIQFRIKREKILLIGIRRTNIFVKLFIIISALIGDLCTDMVSFRFKEAENYEPRLFGKTLKMSSLTEEDESQGIKEFVECLSYRQAKQISTILNIPIQNVVF